MNIKGKIVTLRAIEEEDLPLLHKWSNDPELQDILGNIHFPSSMAFHRDWFERVRKDQLNLRFSIDVPDIGLIGLSTIMDIDWVNGHAHHGLMIGSKDVRGKGYGTDVLMTTMRYAFDEMRLVGLRGSQIEYNQVSYNLYMGKMKWTAEGTIRNFYYRKGRHWNKIVTGVLREEYYRLVEETKYWDGSNE